jgi:branched-chain amino acid transport system permease protein
MNYIFDILILSFIYVVLTSSFNLLLGWGGLLSLAHAISYGIGAYISALLVIHTGMPILLAMLLSMIMTGILALLLAIPTLRVSGEYLAIASLGFSIVIVEILLNLDITGGTAGLTGIAKMAIFGISLTEGWMYALFTGIIAALTIVLVYRIANSPFGRVLKGIREDEKATAGLGKNVFFVRISVFFVSSALAGLAGSLYAHYYQYLNPHSFELSTTILIVSMLIIGGIGTYWGPVVGAFLLMGLPELLRFIDLSPDVKGPLQQILYVVIVLLFIYLRPNGIIGTGKKSKSNKNRLQADQKNVQEGVS